MFRNRPTEHNEIEESRSVQGDKEERRGQRRRAHESVDERMSDEEKRRVERTGEGGKGRGGENIHAY